MRGIDGLQVLYLPRDRGEALRRFLRSWLRELSRGAWLMGVSPVTRPDCDLCARAGRCELQGAHCRDTLFAWADDRPAPSCEGFTASSRADVGYAPRSPSKVASKTRMIRRRLLW